MLQSVIGLSSSRQENTPRTFWGSWKKWDRRGLIQERERTKNCLNRLELRCCGLRENRRYYHSGDWRPTRFMWDHPIKFFLNQPGQQCTRTLFWAFNRLFVSRILLCFFTKKLCWNLKGFLVGKWKCIQIFNPVLNKTHWITRKSSRWSFFTS